MNAGLSRSFDENNGTLGDVALSPGSAAPPNEAIVQSNPRDELADVERGRGREVALSPGSAGSEDGVSSPAQGLPAPPNEAIVQSNPRDELADIERGPGEAGKACIVSTDL